MSSTQYGIIRGSGEIALARLIAELVRQGVIFESRVDLDGEWVVTMTGGY